MKKIFITTIFLISVFNLIGQTFPPPSGLCINSAGGHVMELSWIAPEKSVSYYNIYRNNLLIASTQNTNYIDTLFFIYNNTYNVSAVYTYPAGESNPQLCGLSIYIPLIAELPIFQNFENSAIMAVSVGAGNDIWKVSKVEHYEGNQSIFYTSDSIGNRSTLISCPYNSSDDTEISIKFYYKTPTKNGKNDLLYFLYSIQYSPWVTIGPLPYSEDWTLFEYNLKNFANESRFGFSGQCNDGNGVYLDLFTMNDVTNDIGSVSSCKTVLYQNIPNPCRKTTRINYYISKSGNYNLRVYDVYGKILENYNLKNLGIGNHSVEISTENYVNGIYFYDLSGDNFKQSRKFIVK